MTLLEFLALIVVVLLIVLSFTAPPWGVAGPPAASPGEADRQDGD